MVVPAFAANGSENFWWVAGGAFAACLLLAAVEAVVRRRRVARCLEGGAQGRPWQGPQVNGRTLQALAVLGLGVTLTLAILLDPATQVAPVLGMLAAQPFALLVQDRELRRFDAIADRLAARPSAG